MSKPINENPNPAPRYPAPAIQIHPPNSRDATVARQLAERGWLPGIAFVDGLLIQANKSGMVVATTADLHLAAHTEIVRRGWAYASTPTGISIKRTVGLERFADEPGTTTLALLTCLLRACEEHERATTQASERETPNGS